MIRRPRPPAPDPESEKPRERVSLMARVRAFRARAASPMRWVMEAAGVGAIGGAAAWGLHPAFGVAIGGVYLLVVANSGGAPVGNEEDDNARNR